MKASQATWVRTFQLWAPAALALYLQMIDSDIKTKQALRIAALKAQRLQRKGSKP